MAWSWRRPRGMDRWPGLHRGRIQRVRYLTEPGRIPSPGGWIVPPGVRPAWNWTPPPGIVPRPDRAPRWVRWWYRTPLIDRYALNGCGGTEPGTWSRPLPGRRAAAPRERASLAGRHRHRGLVRHAWYLDLRYRRPAPHRQPPSCEPALVVGLAREPGGAVAIVTIAGNAQPDAAGE